MPGMDSSVTLSKSRFANQIKDFMNTTEQERKLLNGEYCPQNITFKKSVFGTEHSTSHQIF